VIDRLADRISALTGLPIQGALKDRYGDFQNLIVFAGIAMTFGGAVIAAARIHKGGVKWAKT
jgi:MCP family monocarboxylic acid transporter-like MFS transporter 10